MKLISKTLHYNVKTNEQTGMWTEKILCDILKIGFNSKRDYINTKNYPLKLSKDLSTTITPILDKLQITQHVGNRNESYDFLTINGDHVSLKTNTNGFKVCPQTIGQTTLQKLNQYFKTEFNKEQFKEYIMTNSFTVLNEYLKNTFICKHLINIKYDTGKVYYFNKVKPILHNAEFEFTNTLLTWNESNTVKIKINDKFFSLAEFQIHNNRNCIKCRFNFDTIIKLINLGLIKGVTLEEYSLKYKYDIKTNKNE
jgi:hypothetical protein